MAIGKRGKGRQQELFVAASEIRALGNPFYRALNRLLEEEGFDEFAEETCREFYAEKRGRPGIPPGVYFRMLLVGYLEGIGSERGIAWRCGDSISLREFLGYGLERNPPEHSGLSKTRKRLSVELHRRRHTRGGPFHVEERPVGPEPHVRPGQGHPHPIEERDRRTCHCEPA